MAAEMTVRLEELIKVLHVLSLRVHKCMMSMSNNPYHFNST